VIRALPSALELTLGAPASWAVAAAGFLARGGAVLFGGLLLELPSPITVTLIFGIDSVTGTGDPTPRLVATIAAIAVLGLVTVVAIVLVGAWADVVAFARLQAAGDPNAPTEGTIESGAHGVLGLAWLQTLGLLPGLIVLALAAPTVHDVAVGELLLPSSPQVPFIVRVLEGAQVPLLRGVFVLAVCELVVTIATRMYLGARASGSTSRSYEAAFAWILRRPISALFAWLVGWAALLGALAVGLWAVAQAWQELSSVLLDPAITIAFAQIGCTDVKACGGPLDTLALVAAAGSSILFVTVWTAAIALVGVASAFRSTLWTLTVGARPGHVAVLERRADAGA